MITLHVYLTPKTGQAEALRAAILDPGWRERLGGDYSDIEWVATGERLDSASFHAYREEGGMIIAHIIPKDEMEYAIAHPEVMIASDGGISNGRGHPRGSGTYSRVLGKYVREDKALTLMDALRKMTIEPAKRLETFEPILVHTGQHYDKAMSESFFSELGIPEPDVNLGVGSGSHAVQTAQVLMKIEELLIERQPHVVLVVGDVNSTLAATLAAIKLQIPVAHVEAGLRTHVCDAAAHLPGANHADLFYVY